MLEKLIQSHRQKTSSKLAEEILTDWEAERVRFYKVQPIPPAALSQANGSPPSANDTSAEGQPLVTKAA
jgi:glutamate synthase domain-containing protein 3